MTEQHWRTMGRQPCLMNRNGVLVLHVGYAKQKGDKRQNWKRVYSSDQFKPGGWATEAAALAARSCGPRQQQQQAPTAPAAAMTPSDW